MIQSASKETPALFTVVDQGQTRSDLATRKEMKFALPGADVTKLRHLLKTNCRHVIHNEAVSVVRSIYFDDARLSACRANLDGLGRRRKLRIRWYDSLQPSTKFFYEIKWRNNRITGKHRLEIESSQPLSQLPYKTITRELERALPEEHLGMVHAYDQPIVIVQYRREHFVVADSGLRITLDYDLTFYDQFGKRSVAAEFCRRLERFVVVEGKTPIGREGELQRAFHPFAPRVGRCSKYVHGCRLLGHIHGGE